MDDLNDEQNRIPKMGAIQHLKLGNKHTNRIHLFKCVKLFLNCGRPKKKKRILSLTITSQKLGKQLDKKNAQESI